MYIASYIAVYAINNKAFEEEDCYDLLGSLILYGKLTEFATKNKSLPPSYGSIQEAPS